MTRFEKAYEMIEDNRFFTNLQGGLRYEVHCREMDMEYEIEHGIPGIRPNRAGLWLITLATEARFYLQVLRYVMTGKMPIWMEDPDPMGDMMGRNL